MLDKTPHNKQGDEHGHWLLHWIRNGQVMFDLHYVNGVEFGPSKEYYYEGKLEKQTYYAR